MDPATQPEATTDLSQHSIKAKPDVYGIVTTKILEQLEAGVCVWQRPWAIAPAKNLFTGNTYRGFNFLALSYATEFPSRYWASFKQIQQFGGHVKKGEHGSFVVYWKWVEEEKKREIEERVGHPIAAATPFYARVFNLSQTEGITPPDDDIKTHDHPRYDLAENIYKNMPNPPRLEFTNASMARAGYSVKSDLIVMPPMDRFATPEGYYSTLAHEITHSTGAAKRLNRPEVVQADHFGSLSYSAEELCAEIGAAFLCSHCGIANQAQIENSAAYLKGWLEVLKADRGMIVLAAQRAQRAVEYVLGVGDEKSPL